MATHNDIESLLYARNVKPTANRLLIARVMANAAAPLSLADIETALDTIDRSVISRTLALFRERHVVHTIEDGGNAVRYELCRSRHDTAADDDTHVHFHCLRCGRTTCLEHVAVPPVTMPDGYVAHTANYVVKGVCPFCLHHSEPHFA